LAFIHLSLEFASISPNAIFLRLGTSRKWVKSLQFFPKTAASTVTTAVEGKRNGRTGGAPPLPFLPYLN